MAALESQFQLQAVQLPTVAVVAEAQTIEQEVLVVLAAVDLVQLIHLLLLLELQT
jgi:hypothetical protein